MSGTAERLRELAQRAELPLTAAQAETLVRYLEAMLELNQRINLSGIRDPDAALVLHVLDSLHGVRWLESAPAGAFVDLGTGNGFPGVAAAVLHPERTVVLVERRGKKSRAVEELVARAGITNCQHAAVDGVLLPRQRPDLQGNCAAVLARAVGSLEDVVRLASPLLAPGGLVLQWKDEAVTREERESALRAARASGLHGEVDRFYALPPVGAEETTRRRLIVAHRMARPR